ncbi:hypothetical protein K458DRAFT_391824 [Lentithecium fluviatile CBS 122367]|uniref:Osmotin, thaumatin-like protein n=1 Tax=Lentithecium fluviatile CBS 122367 TaxID=1168545 RepID=A0A6G1ITL1_9PLEO|nr:hypothetical protein K458DRAFT_391824 [Lentithecium fluviatile CBS 122367]
MKSLLLVVLPTLALASPSLHARHAHAHAHQHREVERAIKEHWVYETKIVATTTVTYGQIPTPETKPTQAEVADVEVNANVAPETKPSTTPIVVAPIVPTTTSTSEVPIPTTTEEKQEPSSTSTTSSVKAPSTGYPTGTGGQFAIKNNCDYDVSMTIDRTMCGPIERDIPISAGETWYGDITSCDDANPAYKIYKPDNDQPLQLEAGYKPAQSTLWYNISPKDCVSDMYGAGIENCPGGPWYLKAKSTASNPGACQTYQCSDATTCCTSSLGAYCDAFATAAKALGGLEPVGGCLGEVSQISLVAQIC